MNGARAADMRPLKTSWFLGSKGAWSWPTARARSWSPGGERGERGSSPPRQKETARRPRRRPHTQPQPTHTHTHTQPATAHTHTGRAHTQRAQKQKPKRRSTKHHPKRESPRLSPSLSALRRQDETLAPRSRVLPGQLPEQRRRRGGAHGASERNKSRRGLEEVSLALLPSSPLLSLPRCRARAPLALAPLRPHRGRDNHLTRPHPVRHASRRTHGAARTENALPLSFSPRPPRRRR